MKDKYEINELGEVWSNVGNRKLRKQSIGKDGYHRVVLSDSGVTVTKYVHRLVWEACVGPIPAKMTVNHKDLDKSNNRLDNLELMTLAENLAHARERKKWNYKERPISIKRKKLLAVDWEYGGYRTFKEAAEDVSGDAGNISNAIKSGRVSYGYLWTKVG